MPRNIIAFERNNFKYANEKKEALLGAYGKMRRAVDKKSGGFKGTMEQRIRK
jgi:hypothetical protein